jgi:hypothetical protein
MNEFIRKHAGSINGVLHGFDRLVFRGTLRTISHLQGMKLYLSRVRVLLKDFGNHVQQMSDRIKEATEATAQAMGRKVVYLASPRTDKEAVAREIASEHGITDGPICILSTVEVCRSYELYRNRETKQLELEPRWRKCLFYYHYWIHPEFGFMNARLQTWVPFPIQVCLNGREWLCRRLDATDLSYVRRENSLVWVQDFERAQCFLDDQLRASWPTLLGAIAERLNPVHRELFSAFPMDYYWCVYQSEWATDVLFRDPDALSRLYPRFVRHGITSFASPDVMRFLGRKSPNLGQVHPAFKGEIVSSLKRRPEGVRIKHTVNNNSIKLYDKQGSVLRVESTLNNARDLKVYRPKEGQSPGRQSWKPLRKGIADLHRRAQLSQAANERYLDALAAVSTDASLQEITEDLCKPVQYQGKRIRPLRLWDPKEIQLLKIIGQGEFLITGLRNRDLVRALFPHAPQTPEQLKRARAAVSYRLRILRAHGLLTKVQGTHRYLLSPKGRTAITAILAAHSATIEQLTANAA